MNSELYTKITDQIIAAIEKGVGKYEMPWHNLNTFPTNARTGKRYQGINVLSLCVAADSFYKTNLWGTYKQWLELGAQVKKGQKGTMIVFYKLFGVESQQQEDQEEKGKSSTRIFTNYSFVFNADQVEGYIPQAIEPPSFNPDNRIDVVEEFFNSLGADINHGGNKACYQPSTDKIKMPLFETFNDANSYYANLAHEITHWTAHPSRCNRDLSGRFGTQSYAAEELIAELGAAFLCSLLKLNNEPREDHASYIADWLTLLKKDNKAIFTAATKAEQAITWLEEKHKSNSLETNIPNLQTTSSDARLYI